MRCRNWLLILLMVWGLTSCMTKTEPYVAQVVTTQERVWNSVEQLSGLTVRDSLSLMLDTKRVKQKVEGFGACFNELGWASLSILSCEDRESVIKELFNPSEGACFSICRMPVGANDFSRNWYSYNEVAEDYEMYNFSIENDRATLIPFIKSAQKYNPELRIWASPWSPPSWMKHNNHYAAAYTGDNYAEAYRNGLPKDRIGYEGTDMFILDSLHLEAYALYFRKFIQAYRKEGINIYGVMPQNEFNSAQIFPSCCWTAKGLTEFIGKYLGPAMKEENVQVMMGTVERANHLLADSVISDPLAGPYISAAGFQWAGKGAIAAIRDKYPDLPLYQTEQECGDGKNDWNGVCHSWGLLKHYFDCGVSVYDYWNISLLKGGISRWGWAQNSLVVVNPEDRTFEYTYEYYLMKHISHFVKTGAYCLELSGTAAGHCLAFRNPDGQVIILTMEKEGRDKLLDVSLNGKNYRLYIKANSINTIKIQER